MRASDWSTQQLAEFLAAVSASETEASAALTAVERAAEALDAEVAAIVWGDEVVAAVGYPEGEAPVADLASVIPGAAGCELAVADAGICAACAVSMEHPPHATLVLARSGPDALRPEEAALLRGMARVTALTMRMLCLLDDEHAARRESDRRAAENARLLETLTERQAQLERLAQEQAALRRVATLVAGYAPAEDIFTMVAEETCRLLGADIGSVYRYEPDGSICVMAQSAEGLKHLPPGRRIGLEGQSVSAMVLRSGRPQRLDRYEGLSGPLAKIANELSMLTSVGAPVVVDGQVWGVVIASTKRPKPLPPDSEQRLAAFTELVATAISNAQARADLSRLAEDQAALRRVATLVAQGVSPAQIFAAVTQEVGPLLQADITHMVRYETDDTVSVVARWGSEGDLPVGRRFTLEGHSISGLVLETCKPARLDSYTDVPGSVAAFVRRLGVRSSVGAPIVVEGRLWGALVASSVKPQPLAPDTESRIADFAELVATAIANAESRAELKASRVRIVTASDEARRRIERNLHDGIQQRLVTLALQMRVLEEESPPERPELRAQLSHVDEGLGALLDEVREISRGVHPAILSEGGLGPALKSLARRCPLPVELDMEPVGRLPERVEVAAYYVVSEALTNVAKHASASVVHVDVKVYGGTLHLGIRDDGVGGADPGRGSGIIGLTDRVEALGGTIALRSPAGEGTSMVVQLPMELADRPSQPVPPVPLLRR